ncbi:MAG TPA: HD domain-containing protein [bacterium]|nr:HD domain-containing protein [bacterium]
MTVADPIAATAAFIQEKFQHEGSGHDWEHIRRVWQTSRALARAEPAADPLVTELAALLHDVADWKFHDGDLEAGPRAARAWLQHLSLPEETITRIEQVIREVSFKGHGVPTPVSSPEAACVQDADRLDAIGAIGIARAFAYGGHRGRPLHDPARTPEAHASFEAYQRAAGGTISHFYEKLLHLRDRLHTPTARRIAGERHRVLEAFLHQFLREWHGDDIRELTPSAPPPAA